MVRSFLLNIFLALVWTFLQGELRGANFAVGLVLGYLIIAVSERALGQAAYVRKIGVVVRFIGYVLWEVFTASLTLAWRIIKPNPGLRPGIVRVPLDAQGDMEISTVANLITLSPGSAVLDIEADGSALYVHVMDLDDVEAYRRSIKEGFERRVIEVMR